MHQGRPRTRPEKPPKAPEPLPAAPASPSVSHETQAPSPEATHDQVEQQAEAPTTRGRGRPSNYPNIDLALAARFAKAGLVDEQIADLLSISITSFYEYKAEHPEFAEALKAGQEDPKARTKRSLYQRANGYIHPEEKIFVVDGKIVRVNTWKYYPKDTTALIFWLVNKCGDEFKDIRHILASGDVNMNHKGSIPSAFMEDLNKALVRLGERPSQPTAAPQPAPAAKTPSRKPAAKATPAAAPAPMPPPASSADLQGEGDQEGAGDELHFSPGDYAADRPSLPMDLSDLDNLEEES